MKDIMHFFRETDLKGWLSIAAIIISLVNLYRSIREKKINVDASVEIGNNTVDLVIYNNSTRKITISYFKIYSSRFRWLTKRNYAHTWYDDGESPKYLIAPHEYISMRFEDEYSIGDKFFFRGKLRTYVTVIVAGRITRTIKL
ncbi:hypothetical protein GCM10023092_02400 [Rurimicrobium arvi]|uniref:Uncharacterized protein n=1 Tax=Rurimicrobium arvi TaxID=2049916 RepID=A0ABP8MDZ6_9BACT